MEQAVIVPPQLLLNMWLKEREIQNQSKHTLQAYERDVSDFFRVLPA